MQASAIRVKLVYCLQAFAESGEDGKLLYSPRRIVSRHSTRSL